MVDISNNSVFSETDASNTSVTLPGFPENMNPSIVDDAARSFMGAVKRSWDRSNATLTSGGSGNVQTLSYAVAPVSLGTGEVYRFIAGFTNTGSTTLNVNALGAVTLKYQGANLVGGEIVAGQIISVAYDGTNFQLISRAGGVLNPAFTTGSVVFQGVSGLAQDNANFFYDSTNHNLGLGGAAASNWRVGIIGHGATSSTFALVVDSTTAGCLWVRDDGLISFPQYGNGALSVSGGAIVSGVLPAGLGGTGVTGSTGTGSVVLSASPTLSGTAVFSAISASSTISSSAPGNTFGTPSGNITSPLINNTNILLYNNSSTNWAGIGADTAGTMYFVTGVSAPATRLTINPSGTANFTGTVGGGSGWNITAAGAATFNGDMNIGGAYQVSGVGMAQRNGNYFEFFDPSGGGALFLGNTTDPTNYYRNTSHLIEDRAASTVFATFNSSGLTIGAGIVNSPNAGNKFGSSSGSTASPTRANTNILFYDAGSTNWAGTGAAVNGDIYFVTGTSAPATRMVIAAAGNIVYTAASTGLAVATSSLSSNLTFAVSDPGSGLSGGTGGLNLLTNNASRIIITDAVVQFTVGVGIGMSTAHNLQLAVNDALKPTGGSWTDSSDARLKNSFVTEFAALEKINKLKPTLFHWNNAEKHGTKEGEQVGGFIAQDVLEVFPEFVSTHKSDETEDGTEYTIQLPFKFYAYMVKAIQELSAKVDQLQKAGE